MNKVGVDGLVATTPRMVTTEEGIEAFTFRLANSPKGKGHINWLTATAFGEVATQMFEKVQKASRVELWGDLTIRDWDNGERSGTSVEVEISSFLVTANGKTGHTCDCQHCEVA